MKTRHHTIVLGRVCTAVLVILPLALSWLVSSQQMKNWDHTQNNDGALPISVNSWSVSNLVTGSTRDKITEKEAALYADHQCWQASTPVTEENLLGSDLTTTVFSLGWCTDGSAITYLSNLTYTSSSFSLLGNNSVYDREPEIWEEKGPAARVSVVREFNRTSLNSYGYTRCVNFSIDSAGTAEARLTC